MDIISIEGGHPIQGEVKVEGAKNSALKLMAASIMAQGVTTLTNVPDISDVHIMGKVLKRLGADIDVIDKHTLKIDTSGIDKWETPYELVAKMRASTAVLGPLLTKFHRALIAMPGGCNIGARKMDLHFAGLSALGVEFTNDHGYIQAEAPHGLKGADISLDFPSVGATENIIMAAVCAQGTTTIDNAACEPEIVDLANFLNEMGGCIKGAGTPVIDITGVSQLHPVEHAVVGDRIEAGTFLALGALCKDPIRVTGFKPAHLSLVLKKYHAMGVSLEAEENGCVVKREGTLKPVDIQTLPFPGFPTDMQAQTMCLLAMADGECIITENVFENRFMFASEINRMGADITIEGHHAIVRGVSHLSGAQVQAPDLRGGAALVMAGLAAEGITTVSNIYHIDRGYENFVGKLQALGAHIERSCIADDEDDE